MRLQKIRCGSRSSGLVLAMMMIFASGAHGVRAATHKPHRSAPTADTRDTDTSATGTLAAKAPPKPEAPAPTASDDEPLPPPFHLPQASRTRMRDCGLKWQAMKSDGEAGEDIWRDFATRCLAAANGPLDKRSDR